MRSRMRVLGHPLHPMLVMFPVAAFPLMLLFDVLAWLGLGAALWDAGLVLAIAGLATALVAIVPGVVDFMDVPDGTKAHAVGLWHAGVGVTLALLYAVAVFVRWPFGAVPSVGWAVGVDALGTLLVTAQGWLGGEMVYKHHVGVPGPGEGGEPVAREGDAALRPTPRGAAGEGGRRR